MQLIRNLYNLKTKTITGCVATIGNYDGVHLGHQKIINLVRKKSGELNLPSLVILFEPQPEEFFTGDRSQRLSSLREKIVLLKKQKIDMIVLLSFNTHFATTTALQFIDEILVKALQVRHLIVGDDFVFGHKREGNFNLLKQEAINKNFKVTQVPSIKIAGMRVSSSLIRRALLQDKLNLAKKLLGRPYSVCGKVIHGDHRGRDLGFPTANIYLKRRELPLTGVYLVKIHGLTLKTLNGICNIGLRPTIPGKQKSLEVYIFDFISNIYNQRISVEFCKKIRDEQKFDSLIELKSQIKKDLMMAKKYFIVPPFSNNTRELS